MRRRRFVVQLGGGVLASSVAACARTFRIPLSVMAAPSGGPGGELDPVGIWRDGAAYARWTPSPHNTQPWRLRVRSPERGELYYDPRRLLPTTDPTGAFTMMGLAMFAEYLSLAVRPHGVTLKTNIIEQPLDYSATRPVLFATLDLLPTAASPAFDRQLILERKTSRLPYDGRPVEAPAMSALGALAHAPGHHMAWSSDPEFVRWAIELNRFTLFSDLDDAPTRRELSKWMRFTDQEAAAQNDGLWSHCLHMPGRILRGFFEDHAKWGRGWRANLCGRMLVHSMKGTSTVAWWSGPFTTPADWISAGRVLGSSWLELTRRGVQMHPFGSIITNPRAHAQLRDKVGAPEGSKQLWLMARLGRSATPPRSYRVPEPAVFLDDHELS